MKLRDALDWWDALVVPPRAEPHYVTIVEAARRVANLTQDDLLKVVGRAMYEWGPDEPNDATGFTTAADVAEVTDAVWKWLGITEDE